MLFGSPSIEQLLAAIIALVVGLTFHEFSHALVADRLGDRGPRLMGRLTLNPIPHIDPLGALMLLIARFGWAKPVMVNPAALRNGREGMAMVAAAGPSANLIVATAFGVLFRVLDLAGLSGGFIAEVVSLVVLLNVVLALFNLLPIPPLDGYNVALAFLPARQAMTLRRYGQYGVFILLGMILLSYLGSPVNPLAWIFGIAAVIARLLLGL
jgi:Zn-dependent protease